MARPNRISRYLTEIQRIYIIRKLKQGFSYRQIAQEFKQKFERKISHRNNFEAKGERKDLWESREPELFKMWETLTLY